MATIDWAHGTTGTWTTAADWAGGVVPGPNDTAVIDAPGRYVVHVNTAVDVGAIVLDSADATLSDTHSLACADLQLQSGKLQLSHGSLSGTVTGTGGTLVVKTTGTLDAVTWQGTLLETSKSFGTLTLKDGFAMTGADGSGIGTASFASAVVLDHVAELNNMDVTFGNYDVTLSNTPTFTIGSTATLTNLSEAFTSGTQTIINDGVLARVGLVDQSASGTALTVVNNGTITSGEILGHFTNDGAIDVTKDYEVELSYAGVSAPGKNGSIHLDSSYLVLAGTLTTADYLAFLTAQHVKMTGNSGTGVDGLLDNTGDTTSIGTGTALGMVVQGTITSGTVIDQGGGTGYGGVTLENLAYESTAPTLTLGFVTEDNVSFTGATTLDLTYGAVLNGGTLANVGTIQLGTPKSTSGYYLTLNGVDLTGPAGGGPVTFDVEAFTVELTAAQNCNGDIFDIGFNTAMTLDDGQTLSGAQITLSQSRFLANGTATLGVGTTLTAAVGTLTTSVNESTLINQGTIAVAPATNYGVLAVGGFNTTLTLTNQGLITVADGGVLAVDYNYPEDNGGTLVNQGTIQISTGGTVSVSTTDFTNDGTIIGAAGSVLHIDGDLTLGQLEAMAPANFGGIVQLAGDLDLGGASITIGAGGAPNFEMFAATVSDGAITIGKHTDFLSAAGTFSLNLTNNGTISLEDSHSFATNTDFDGTISGTGTIILDADNYSTTFNGPVSAGQTVVFPSTTQFNFGTDAAAMSFAGTLSGFAVGDLISFSGGETLTAANFVGSSLAVTLSTGATIALHTASALTGSLTIEDGYIVEYASAGAAAHGQTASAGPRDDPPAALPHWHGWDDAARLVSAVALHRGVV